MVRCGHGGEVYSSINFPFFDFKQCQIICIYIYTWHAYYLQKYFIIKILYCECVEDEANMEVVASFVFVDNNIVNCQELLYYHHNKSLEFNKMA